jgi:hypothetical protein
VAVEHGENHIPAVDVISKAVAKKRAAVTGVKEEVSRVAGRLADREAESTNGGIKAVRHGQCLELNFDLERRDSWNKYKNQISANIRDASVPGLSQVITAVMLARMLKRAEWITSANVVILNARNATFGVAVI